MLLRADVQVSCDGKAAKLVLDQKGVHFEVEVGVSAGQWKRLLDEGMVALDRLTDRFNLPQPPEPETPHCGCQCSPTVRQLQSAEDRHLDP